MTHHVRANGLDVAYEVHGAGPPLVMLHGATSSGREDFAAQVPLFSRTFRIYLPDARGHARTRWDASAGLDPDVLVDDLAAFVDALGLETFHLLGFSMGAMTALACATRNADRLRTLVLAGTAAEREPRTSVIRHLADPERVDREDPGWGAGLAQRHDRVQGPGAWRTLLRAIVEMTERQTPPGPAALRSATVPALVVVGDRDPFVRVGQAWELARQLPDGRLFVVPDCGHEVMVRRAALFNEGCASFYRATESIAVERVRAGGRVAVPAEALDRRGEASPPVDTVPSRGTTRRGERR